MVVVVGTGSSNSSSISRTIGSHDAGFNCGTDHQHSIKENLANLKAKYDYNNGYFGIRGSGKGNRRIKSENPLKTAQDFYATATLGGIESPLPSGEGVRSYMKDQTVVSFRSVSKSFDRSPAIDISIRQSKDFGNLKSQKIHFI